MYLGAVIGFVTPFLSALMCYALYQEDTYQDTALIRELQVRDEFGMASLTYPLMFSPHGIFTYRRGDSVCNLGT